MSDNEEPAPGASEQLTIRIKDQVRAWGQRQLSHARRKNEFGCSKASSYFAGILLLAVALSISDGGGRLDYYG